MSENEEKTFSEVFDEQFVEYLALGMTYEQFWLEDVTLVRAYRKAYRLKYEREQDLANWKAWIQGRYVYDALVEVAPYLNSLKPKEPLPYDEKPYEIKRSDDPKPTEASKEIKEETEAIENARNYFFAIAMEFNKNRKK